LRADQRNFVIPNPGEILKEEFLNTIDMSPNQLAHAIGVPGNRIHAIVKGTRAIAGDTDLRLRKFFGLSDFPAVARLKADRRFGLSRTIRNWERLSQTNPRCQTEVSSESASRHSFVILPLKSTALAGTNRSRQFLSRPLQRDDFSCYQNWFELMASWNMPTRAFGILCSGG
jgi:addiction module HigA family antidote